MNEPTTQKVNNDPVAFDDLFVFERNNKQKGSKYNGTQIYAVDSSNLDSPYINIGGEDRHHPASLTKLMTFYLVREELAKLSGKVNRDTPVPFGDKSLTMTSALEALMVNSDNKVADSLAVLIGEGDNPQDKKWNFVKKMNEKAKELGLDNTYFVNPSGLPWGQSLKQTGIMDGSSKGAEKLSEKDKTPFTTPHDMAKLMQQIYKKFPESAEHYLEKSSVKYEYLKETPEDKERIEPAHHFLNNKNAPEQLGGIDGIRVGVKTGFVNESGHNIVAMIQKTGKPAQIIVVMGGDWIPNYRVSEVVYDNSDLTIGSDGQVKGNHFINSLVKEIAKKHWGILPEKKQQADLKVDKPRNISAESILEPLRGDPDFYNMDSYSAQIAHGKEIIAWLVDKSIGKAGITEQNKDAVKQNLQNLLGAIPGLEVGFGDPKIMKTGMNDSNPHNGIFQDDWGHIAELNKLINDDLFAFQDNKRIPLWDIDRTILATSQNNLSKTEPVPAYVGQGAIKALGLFRDLNNFVVEAGGKAENFTGLDAYYSHLLGNNGAKKLEIELENNKKDKGDAVISNSAYDSNFLHLDMPMLGGDNDFNPKRIKHDEVTAEDIKHQILLKVAFARYRLVDGQKISEDDQRVKDFDAAFFPNKSKDEIHKIIDEMKHLQETGQGLRAFIFASEGDTKSVLANPLPEMPPSGNVEFTRLNDDGTTSKVIIKISDIPTPYAPNSKTKLLQEGLAALGKDIEIDGMIGVNTAKIALQDLDIKIPELSEDLKAENPQKSRKPEVWKVESSLLDGSLIGKLLPKVREETDKLAQNQAKTPEQQERYEHGVSFIRAIVPPQIKSK